MSAEDRYTGRVEEGAWLLDVCLISLAGKNRVQYREFEVSALGLGCVLWRQLFLCLLQ